MGAIIPPGQSMKISWPSSKSPCRNAISMSTIFKVRPKIISQISLKRQRVILKGMGKSNGRPVSVLVEGKSLNLAFVLQGMS
jgi:hypothetical protein